MKFNYRQGRSRKRSLLRKKNPLFSKKSWQQYIIERLGTFGLLIILGILLLLYIIFYSPIFQITKVEVSGPDSVIAKDINDKYIVWQLEQRRLVVFRQNNVFLFDTDWLQDNIESKYSFTTLIIDKKIPKTIIVTFEKKSPEIIWDSGGIFYNINEYGIVASLKNKTDDTVSIPIITESSESADDNENINTAPSKKLNPGDELFSDDKMEALDAIIKEIDQIKDFTVTGYSLPHRLSTKFMVQTDQSYEIYFDLSKDISQQMDKLIQVLATKVKEEAPQSYIDLRVGDRVYMK